MAMADARRRARSRRHRAAYASNHRGASLRADGRPRHAWKPLRSAGLALIEDCAQAHGARWRGRPVGSRGVAACFSFYPSKNLGTVGDGGMVTTSDGPLASRIAALRQYGWSESREALVPGWNSRLGPLQAAILEVKLRHLPQMVEGRRLIADRYHVALADLPLELPHDRDGSRHAYHLYVALCEDEEARDGPVRHLATRRIAAGIHYPVPVHLQAAYRGRLNSGDLGTSESAAKRVISLPLNPELAAPDQDRVIAGVRGSFGRSS